MGSRAWAQDDLIRAARADRAAVYASVREMALSPDAHPSMKLAAARLIAELAAKPLSNDFLGESAPLRTPMDWEPLEE